MAVVACDAASMLAEALEQMDGLINNDTIMAESLKSVSPILSPNERLLSLLDEVKTLVEGMTYDARTQVPVPHFTAEFITDWLASVQNSCIHNGKNSSLSNGDTSRVQIDRLEEEKESLILQVSVLTDQVEAQGEKIRDTEFSLEEMRVKLEDTEQQLEKEQTSFANLACEKVELVAEISALKLKLEAQTQTQEKSTPETPESLTQSSEDLLAEKDMEIEMLKDHIEVLLDEQENLQKAQHSQVVSPNQSGSGLKAQIREKASEVNRLKLEVETLNAKLEDRDNQVQELQQTVARFRRVEGMLMKANQRIGSDGGQLSSNDGASIHSADAVLSSPGLSISPEASDSESNITQPEQQPELQQSNLESSIDSQEQQLEQQLLSESYAQAVNNPVTPSLKALKTQPDKRSDNFSGSRKSGIRASFGRGLMKIRRRHSSSEPNLSATEQKQEDTRTKAELTTEQHTGKPVRPLEKAEPEKKKGIGRTIGKAFGKLRRTRSLNINPEDTPLTRPLDLKPFPSTYTRDYGDHLELPFAKWSTQMVVSWLDDLGLGRYTEACQRTITCGSDLLRASGVELERDLGIGNPLHRKKLQLALQALTSDGPDVMGRLSIQWVLGWLEDIGLPQYKDTFSECCVDGRMLNYLTYDDLFHLKVHNALHHVSIKRAIQCLRLHSFHPNCLKRYPVDESWQKGAEVLLWTNGRVMEWLRLVDLAEYAPNLRGSGVHGALMILEPRFTPETLAALLSIPPGKTLLRRHLASHIQSLIGAECQQMKDTAAKTVGFTPLMPGAKHKVVKKSRSLGALRKRSKGDLELDDYVCPMDLEIPSALQSFVTQRNRRNVSNSGDEFPGPRLRSNSDEMKNKDVGPIGAFSQELDSLTWMLNEERHAEKDRVFQD